MLATAVIVFREIFEMSIVVGVVLAAAKGAPGLLRWTWIGLGGGLAGAALLAASADVVSGALSGMGPELLNASVMALAAGLIGWTTVWMKRHGRDMSRKLSQAGRAVVSGDAPIHMLAVIIALAVLREGSEAVLFLYGIALSQQSSVTEMVSGAIVGVATGAAVGAMLYFGLLRISPKYLFSVTGALLTLLAAGMAAQSAGFLVAANVLPPLVDPLWDTSALLSESSLFGRLLTVLVGYQDHPTGIQALVYAATVAVIAVGMRAAGRPQPSRA